MDREYAVFLFEVGNDKVFHIVKEHELKQPPHPYKVYWQSKRTGLSYGPFLNVQSAMYHYGLGSRNDLIADPTTPKPKADVIPVDFILKRRIESMS